MTKKAKAELELEELIEEIIESTPEVTSIEKEGKDKEADKEEPDVTLSEYKLEEEYKKDEVPEELEKTEEQISKPSDVILEWEQGLKDEDAIYKDPIEKIQDILEDLNKPGKRFLDRRTQKYEPS